MHKHNPIIYIQENVFEMSSAKMAAIMSKGRWVKISMLNNVDKTLIAMCRHYISVFGPISI